MHRRRLLFLAGSSGITELMTTTSQAKAHSSPNWVSSQALIHSETTSTSTESSTGGINTGGANQTLNAFGNPVSNTTGTSTAHASTPPAATGSQAMATTSGPFLDFLVTFVAMVMMLMTHKFIRSFLDALIPAGSGGGPGSLMSGLMEGVGIGVGSKVAGAGMGIAKAGVGLAASGGIAGLAGARSFLKGKESLKPPKLKNPIGGGIGVSIGNGNSGLLSSGKAAPLALPSPEEEGWTMTDATSGESVQGPGVGGFSFHTDPASTEGTQSASGAPANTSSTTFKGTSASGLGETTRGAGSMFDSTSRMGKAHTQMMPSAKEKLDALESRPQYKSATGAFVGEAGRRLKQDLGHKATHRGGYDGAHSLMGVAMNEFGDRGAEQKLHHDQSLPSTELLKAANFGGPNSDAARDVSQIGQHQQMMDRGMDLMTEGDSEQQTLSPTYEAARTNYELAENDVNLLGANLTQAREVGATDTPQFAQTQATYDQAVQRRDIAKAQYLPVQARMERAQNLSERGERHVAQAQNAISQINWKYYSPSASLMRQAQNAATNRGLSHTGGRRR